MDDKSKASAGGAAASASKDEKSKEEMKAEATEKGSSSTSSAKNADENSRTKEASETNSSKETASSAAANESKRSREEEDGSEESAKKKSKKDDTNATATTTSSSGSVKPSRGTRGSLSDKGEKTTKGSKRNANADKRSSPTSSATNSPKKPASRDQSDEEEDGKQKGSSESSAAGGSEPKVPPLKIVLSGGSNGTSNSMSDDKKSPTGSAKDDAKEVDKPASASESSAALAATAASTGAAEISSENTNQSAASGEGMDENDSKSASNSNHGTLGTRLTRSRANQGTPGPSDQGNDSPREHSSSVNAQCENANLEAPTLKETPAASSVTMASGSGSNMASQNSQSSNNMNYAEYHVKKRKLRSQVEDSSANNGAAQASSGSSFASTAGDNKTKGSNGAAVSNGNEPLNDIEKYLNIRKQVEQRRKNLFPVQPKPPQGFKDYLMNRKTYLLQDNHHLRSVPKLQPPHSLEGPLKELFREQEEERYKLRLKHVVEKEKLVLAVEQEILRVHGRAARALANQSLPYSVCTILRDEEIYTPIDPQQEEKNRDIRSRYNGRLFLSWLQDVDDKWEKIKEQMVLRHHNEAESLNAVQKMDWEWKVNEITGGNGGVGVPLMDDLRIPMVHVSDDFDMSECETESSLFRANQRVAGHN